MVVVIFNVYNETNIQQVGQVKNPSAIPRQGEYLLLYTSKNQPVPAIVEKIAIDYTNDVVVVYIKHPLNLTLTKV